MAIVLEDTANYLLPLGFSEIVIIQAMRAAKSECGAWFPTDTLLMDCCKIFHYRPDSRFQKLMAEDEQFPELVRNFMLTLEEKNGR